ncbi:MAG: MASE1 domain-containing protein [Gaiellaceae bacterium]|jgi:signal transduction histidine kinase
MTTATSSVELAREARERSPVRRLWAFPPARYAVRVVVLVGVYYGSAKLGYALGFSGPVAAIVWLPVGVAVAGLSLYGIGLWPAVLIGDLLSNSYSALPLGAAIGQTCGNMLEVLVAAVLVRRLLDRGSPLRTIAGVGGLLGALALGTLISATVGPLVLNIAGVVPARSLVRVIRTWWLGDLGGALMVVPLVIAWRPLPIRLPARRRLLEAAVLAVAAAALGEVAVHSHDPLSYLAFPGLIWAAVRFGERGATLVVAVTGSIAIWATTHSEGPFVFASIGHSVVSTQLFIAVSAGSSLCLAALVAEREALALRFGETRAQLFHAAESERHRIERDLHDGAQQHLLALAVRLHLAAERTDGSAGWVSAAFTDAERDLNVALDELRNLSQGMHPSLLTELGLAHAITNIAARSSIPVTILGLPATPAGDLCEATVYFVVMEGIANAMRHAGASSIAVRVVPVAENLCVEITDDGNGGAVEHVGSGLAGLRQRVEAAGGTFDVASGAEGTRLTALVPVAP